MTVGVAAAWSLADRWPGREDTRRVWVHTCSQDGPTAMANYERRGFKVFKTETEPKEETPTPAPGRAPDRPTGIAPVPPGSPVVAGPG